MVDLSELLVSIHPTGTPPVKEFYVFNSNHWNANNGGCCFQWTVPAKTTFIKFEIIGGGGPGNGQSSSDWGTGGAGGNYASKSIYASGTCLKGGSNYETRSGAGESGFTCGTCCTTNGSNRPCVSQEGTCVISPNIDTGTAVYTICAAGTSECSCCLCCQDFPCRHGCPSYVNGPGLGTTTGTYQDADINFCVLGGTGGTHFCDTRCSCYNCFMAGQCCHDYDNGGWKRTTCTCGFGYDQFFAGTAGYVQKGYSCNSDMSVGPGSITGPFSSSNYISGDYCTCNIACCSGHSMWPGGGGSPFSDDDQCGYGAFGAGGMVKVTYQ